MLLYVLFVYFFFVYLVVRFHTASRTLSVSLTTPFSDSNAAGRRPTTSSMESSSSSSSEQSPPASSAIVVARSVLAAQDLGPGWVFHRWRLVRGPVVRRQLHRLRLPCGQKRARPPAREARTPADV